MKELFENKGYIVNDAVGLDWSYHKGTKEVQVAGKGKALNESVNILPEGTEYMVVRDFKDDKEYEFSIIVKDTDDKYFFVTDAPGTIVE